MCVKGKSILAYRDFNPQRVNERFISELGRTTAYQKRSSVTIQQKGSTGYGGVVVGLTHSRGVGRVMPVELRSAEHSKGSAIKRKEVVTTMLNTETGKTWEKLSLIAKCAKGNSEFQFTSLAHLLYCEKSFAKTVSICSTGIKR